MTSLLIIPALLAQVLLLDVLSKNKYSNKNYLNRFIIFIMSFGGGFIPSCSIAAKRSGTPQCSINLPSLKRMISMTVISIFFPVAGIGPNCPFCIPRAVIRPETIVVNYQIFNNHRKILNA